MLFFEENNKEYEDESALFIKDLKENEKPKENEISVDLEKNNEVKYREDRKEEEVSKKLEENLTHNKSLSLSERLKNTDIYQQTLISRCIQVKK